VTRRHGRADLQRPGLTAFAAPDRERQAARSLSSAHQPFQVQHAPPVAVVAVGVQLVLPLVEPAEGAEVDHVAERMQPQAQAMSRNPGRA
jgi:hypothetical protein